MKQPKNLILYLSITLLLILFALLSLKAYLGPNVKVGKSAELYYNLTSEKTELNVGDTVSIPVYLTGSDAAKSSAYDVKLYYDSNKFRLDKVVPGGFFNKYITVKWDPEQSWFALAQTPSDPMVEPDASMPILILDLTAIEPSELTQVSTGASTVYVTKTGGFHPQAGSISFTIK